MSRPDVPIVRTYRVPTRKVYNRIRIDENLSWNDVYGNKRCFVCKKKFKEKDAYRMTIDHRGYHVDCESTGDKGNKQP